MERLDSMNEKNSELVQIQQNGVKYKQNQIHDF